MDDGIEKLLNVDFVSLAIKDPDFEQIYSSCEGRVDFHNPIHLQYGFDILISLNVSLLIYPRQLTKAILTVNFDLQVELPHDRLCPPVG